MQDTPKANRLGIAIFGRTNVGKSSLMNMLAGQDIAITSPVAGTTTDVVEKACELLPLGPVLFLDTAGVDDKSELSGLRLKKTRKIYDRADVILLVTEPGVWTKYEDDVLSNAGKRNVPVIVIVNKTDIVKPEQIFIDRIKDICGRIVEVSSTNPLDRDACVNSIKQNLIDVAPEDFVQPPRLIADLVSPGGIAVLVVPIDIQAPKGRIILPQVQTIRDALDSDAAAFVVKENELSRMLSFLKIKPDVVVTDSQAILQVSKDVPEDVKLTTFSIIFARQKGDLSTAAEGAAAIDALKPGDKVLIAEACTHHALEADIGRIKIPRWMKQYLGFDVMIESFAGRDYPDNLSEYKLIIHCGACMLTRREMMARIQKANQAGVPITNYGVAISFLQGVIRRSLEPFPQALAAFEKKLETVNKG
jgi:[FeFe] hydrogenase H-cluster maturation GTPase HydF